MKLDGAVAALAAVCLISSPVFLAASVLQGEHQNKAMGEFIVTECVAGHENRKAAQDDRTALRTIVKIITDQPAALLDPTARRGRTRQLHDAVKPIQSSLPTAPPCRPVSQH